MSVGLFSMQPGQRRPGCRTQYRSCAGDGSPGSPPGTPPPTAPPADAPSSPRVIGVDMSRPYGNPGLQHRLRHAARLVPVPARSGRQPGGETPYRGTGRARWCSPGHGRRDWDRRRYPMATRVAVQDVGHRSARSSGVPQGWRTWLILVGHRQASDSGRGIRPGALTMCRDLIINAGAGMKWVHIWVRAVGGSAVLALALSGTAGCGGSTTTGRGVLGVPLRAAAVRGGPGHRRRHRASCLLG
jgi:hypothetical protein